MRHILVARAGSLFFVLLLFLSSGPVSARILLHADYARSEPAAEETLATPPATVKVWFTQELFRRDGENWLHVTGPDGARVDVGDALVDDNDRTLVSVSLADALPDGLYRVDWRALSADDGHPEEGTFEFRIDMRTSAPANETAGDTPTPVSETVATPVPAATAPPASGGGGLPCLGAAPLALLAVGTVLARRKGSG